MSLRRSTLAFAAATAVFLAVAVAVTALLEEQVWPSAAIGLLVGAVAGAAALIYVRSRIDRATGLALAVFGVVFLPVLAALVLARVRLSVAFLSAGVVGALAGLGSALDERIGEKIR